MECGILNKEMSVGTVKTRLQENGRNQPETEENRASHCYKAEAGKWLKDSVRDNQRSGRQEEGPV